MSLSSKIFLNSKIHPLREQFISNFITNSIICMANGIENEKLCFVIFSKSCSIIGLECSDFKKFSPIYNEVQDNFNKNYYNEMQNIYTYADYLLLNMQKSRMIWEFYFAHHKKDIDFSFEIVKKKVRQDNNISSWPITSAFFIWPWLHIIAIDMDLNCGFQEKSSFLKFIADIIACSECKHHYIQHLNELLKSLTKTTCANTILALHTYINLNRNYQNNSNTNLQFRYQKELVQKNFLLKYQKEYLLLKTLKN